MVKKVLIMKSQSKTGILFIRFNIGVGIRLQSIADLQLSYFKMSDKEDIPKTHQQSNPNNDPPNNDESQNAVPQKSKITKQQINQQINERIKHFETKRIRSMTYSELMGIEDFKKEGKQPQNLPNNQKTYIRQANAMLGKPLSAYDHLKHTPAEQHLLQIRKVRDKNQITFRQSRQTPIWAHIKRGRLGIDNFFIAFALLGGILLPLLFYNYWDKRKKIIIESRIAPPQVIKRLDENSAISIDDVSIHTIHYYNPNREKQVNQRRKKYEQFQKLKKDLDF